MEVEMKIRGLMVDPVTNMPIVVLKDVNGMAILPIWVGVYEANAIALEIEKVATPRPMTHDLIRNLLFGLETGVKKVVVSDLKEDTVVFTHFANINAVTASALRLENTAVCRPDYASITEFSVVNGDIRLVMHGTEIKGPNE